MMREVGTIENHLTVKHKHAQNNTPNHCHVDWASMPQNHTAEIM